MGLERVFDAPWTLRKLRGEPLGGLLEAFCDWLLDCGYPRDMARKHLGRISHLNQWLAEQGRRGLSEAQAQGVLESVDRTTVVGRRDYAILTLLYTYGVRGGQVRSLRQSDIAWARNQILFRAIKGGKDSLLPLTSQVGQSLLDYLQKARPRCRFPEVFLTCRAPYGPVGKISEIVRRNLKRAGIDAPSPGAHGFRHAFATRMVARGHPLKAVADVLGHRCLSTTFLYTKVDFKALSQVALEWPKEVRS